MNTVAAGLTVPNVSVAVSYHRRNCPPTTSSTPLTSDNSTVTVTVEPTV